MQLTVLRSRDVYPDPGPGFCSLPDPTTAILEEEGENMFYLFCSNKYQKFENFYSNFFPKKLSLRSQKHGFGIGGRHLIRHTVHYAQFSLSICVIRKMGTGYGYASLSRLIYWLVLIEVWELILAENNKWLLSFDAGIVMKITAADEIST